MEPSDYGAKFDKPVAVIMAFVIIAAIVGVVMLKRYTAPACTAAEYTYCGETKSEH